MRTTEEFNKKLEELNNHYFSKDSLRIEPNLKSKLQKYTRKQVRAYVSDPVTNYDKLQQISESLENLSGIYLRFLFYLSNLFTFDYILYPLETVDKKSILKKFKKVANDVGRYNIKFNFQWILQKWLKQGEVYLYKIRTGNDIAFMEIPYEVCKLSYIENGVHRYKVNLRKIHEDKIASYPLEIINAWNTHKNTKSKTDDWYEVSQNGMAFSLFNNSTKGFPMFRALFDDLLAVEDEKSLMEYKRKLDAIILIHQKIPMDEHNKPVFNKDIVTQYHEATKRSVGADEGESLVKVTTNPMEIKPISLSEANDKAQDMLTNSERSVFTSSGITESLFNSTSKTGENINKSIITDEMLINPFIKMFENYLNTEIKASGFGIKILETTFFNREEKLKSTRESLANGGSRMMFLSCSGLEPYQSLNLLQMEQDMDIDSLLVPALNSHTLTGEDLGNTKDTNPVSGGRPKKVADEKSNKVVK